MKLLFTTLALCFLGFLTNGQKVASLDNVERQEVDRQKVSFYLTNESLKSIPLIIPDVMNPNLSPKSSSGVTLRMGQKIYFKKKLKRYLLLEVTDAIADGQQIEVSQLINKRKKELGL